MAPGLRKSPRAGALPTGRLVRGTCGRGACCARARGARLGLVTSRCAGCWAARVLPACARPCTPARASHGAGPRLRTERTRWAARRESWGARLTPGKARRRMCGSTVVWGNAARSMPAGWVRLCARAARAITSAACARGACWPSGRHEAAASLCTDKLLLPTAAPQAAQRGAARRARHGGAEAHAAAAALP